MVAVHVLDALHNPAVELRADRGLLRFRKHLDQLLNHSAAVPVRGEGEDLALQVLRHSPSLLLGCLLQQLLQHRAGIEVARQLGDHGPQRLIDLVSVGLVALRQLRLKEPGAIVFLGGLQDARHDLFFGEGDLRLRRTVGVAAIAALPLPPPLLVPSAWWPVVVIVVAPVRRQGGISSRGRPITIGRRRPIAGRRIARRRIAAVRRRRIRCRRRVSAEGRRHIASWRRVLRRRITRRWRAVRGRVGRRRGAVRRVARGRLLSSAGRATIVRRMRLRNPGVWSRRWRLLRGRLLPMLRRTVVALVPISRLRCGVAARPIPIPVVLLSVPCLIPLSLGVDERGALRMTPRRLRR
mmetsp:Transcript_80766/g.234239  ORF Transcript_80766/g.234239 Transcript_80766/m.234239 type:complete len:352 (-) Transcript_80766:426-1481(-)